MKTLLIVIALIFATNASANCPEYGNLASVVMEKRQAGLPMSKLMDIATSDKTFQSIIMQAYSRPQFASKRHIDREIKEFTNVVLLACYKSENK